MGGGHPAPPHPFTPQNLCILLQYVEDTNLRLESKIIFLKFPRTSWTQFCCRNNVSSFAREHSIVKEANCFRTQKCSGKFQKDFLLSRRKFCVFDICCLWAQKKNHLGNTEETWLNVSRIVSSFVYLNNKFWRLRICVLIFYFLPVCSPMQHCDQHWLKMFLQQCVLVLGRRPLRVVFHWTEFSARNDIFFCLLTPTLRQLVF